MGTDNQRLHFHRLTFNSLPLVLPYLHTSGSRSCDYTVGGIYMWIDYFKYHYCSYRDTLLIKGVAEDDVKRTAFSLPLGAMPLSESVELLKNYCDTEGITLEFSAITEERIDDFRALNPTEITELSHWSDYIYRADKLATFAGNKMKKKRNHVNKFLASSPDHHIAPLSPDHLAVYLCVFEGFVVFVGTEVVAFAIGEVTGTTLHVHIEKTDHSFDGANEYIAQAMVRHIASLHDIDMVNREDDAGDPGLQQSKLSYYPDLMLRKYNVIF